MSQVLESFSAPGPGSRSVDSAIDALAKRIAALEAKVSSPSIMSGVVGNQFNTIILGPKGVVYGGVAYGEGPYGGVSGSILLTAATSAPTNLVLTSGAFLDRIHIDVAWTSPGSGLAIEFEVEVSKKVGSTYELQQVHRTAATNIRIPLVEPLTTYGVRVFALNRVGVRSTSLPAEGFQDITTSVDATIPGTPAGLRAGGGLRSVTISWNDVADPDVARGAGLYEVWIATDDAFTTDVQIKRVSGEITAFTDLVPNTRYWYRVAAIDSSGNQGSFTFTGLVWTQQTGAGDIGDGTIVTDHVTTAGLSAAVIKFGTMSGDRIEVNSLEARRLKTSTLTAAEITLGAGGAFRAGIPPTRGLLFNDTGLHFYANGLRTIFLDATTGNSTYSGTVTASRIEGSTIVGSTVTGSVVRTAETGGRTQLDTGSPNGTIGFYTQRVGGDYARGAIYSNYDVATADASLVILSPQSTSSSHYSTILMRGSASLSRTDLYTDQFFMEGLRFDVHALMEIRGDPVPVLRGSGSAVFGAVFPQDREVYIQAGTVVVTTNSSGFGRALFPRAFSNGVISVVASNGDYNASPFEWVSLGGYSLGHFDFLFQPNPGVALRRVNYIAIGW